MHDIKRVIGIVKDQKKNDYTLIYILRELRLQRPKRYGGFLEDKSHSPESA